MEEADRHEVLKHISIMQHDGCAPVTVQIGSVSGNTGIVQHDTLYIKDCPPKIISELSGMGYSLGVSDEGVYVR